MFKNRIESSTFWLSFLILAFLILEDILFFSFLSEKFSSFYLYTQFYSALAIAGLILIIVFYAFITDKEFPYVFMIIVLGLIARVLAINYLPWYADVLKVTEEAAKALISGENPYTHIFSIGPKNVFAYPPFEPIYYLPFLHIDIRYGELFASSITLILVYLTGKLFHSKLTIPALTFYSFNSILIASVGIGVNDVSAGMLIALSTFLFIFSIHKKSFKILIISAIITGLAVCFKQFSIFFPFFFLVYLKKQKLSWKLYAFPFLATIALICFPFLILNPLEFLKEVLMFHIAERIYSPQFILYHLLPKSLKPFYESQSWTIAYIAILTFILFFFAYKTKTLRNSIAYPILAWLVSLFLGRYLTISYFAFLAPLVCLLVLIPSKD